MKNRLNHKEHKETKENGYRLWMFTECAELCLKLDDVAAGVLGLRGGQAERGGLLEGGEGFAARIYPFGGAGKE